MDLHVKQFQDISISHMYIEADYSTWIYMWKSFRTSVNLTCILKHNIAHGVICGTDLEHQYISHEFWKRVLYMERHMVQFQNISMSHMYIEADYSTWIYMWKSFRTSVNLTCILKHNIAHGVICGTDLEHQYISYEFWTRVLYMEWHMVQFQNISMSHMYIEADYSTWIFMWKSFRTSVNLTCILKHTIAHGVTCGSDLEHQYISKEFETKYCTWSDMWYSFRTSVFLTYILKQDIHTDWILFL